MMKRKIFQAVFGVGLALIVFGNTVFASGLSGMDGTVQDAVGNGSWVEESSETVETPEGAEEALTAEEISDASVETLETEEASRESEEAVETEEASKESEETAETEETSKVSEETAETEEVSEEGEKAPETEEASEEGKEASSTDGTSEESKETTETDETFADSGEYTEISGTESEPEEPDATVGTEEEMETVSAAEQRQKATVATPKFVIKGIFGGRTVTLTSDSQGAVIYYKSGSSNITLQDQHIENGGTITFTNFYGTIYAKAYKDGVWSDVAKFILKIPVVNAPTITVEGNKATIRSTTPASYICYTTDGSKPSWENGKRIANCGGTVTVEEGSTIRAVAVRSCFTDSQEVQAYVPILPVAFEVKGIFGGRNVTMTSNTAGVEIYYSTTTGSITTNDKKLTNGGNIDFSDFYGTVYARAYKNGKWSNVSRLILKIPNINTPTITVSGKKVTVATTTPSCYICYTTDGSNPTPTHGTKIYGSKVTFQVPAGKTVKAIAIRSCFTNSPVVSAYVDGSWSVNSREVTLYGMNKWAEDYLTIPGNMATSFQLKVSGASNPTYQVISGSSVEVSSTGLITPKYKMTYWYNSGGFSMGYPSPLPGQEPIRISKDGVYGDSTIRVTAENESIDITVSFVDYTTVYANQVIDQYIADNITASMTAYEKVEQACKFAASYEYSASHSGAVSMIVCGGGDCWASTDAIIRICEKLGMKAWSRNGNRDPGAGSGHMNAMVEADGVYYEAEAGYSEPAPRYYSIKTRNSLYSYLYYSSYNGIELYQYDGPEKIAVHNIPEEIDGKKVVGIGANFLSMDRTVTTVKLPSTIQYINKSAFNSCTELQSIEIPASVKTIGNFVFTQCPKLTNLTCASANPYFSASGGCLYNKDKTVLLYAPAVKTLSVPNTVKTIGTYAFYYNSNLTSVKIPASVTSLEEGAFGHNDNLKEAVFEGNGLVTLGDYAFAECRSLEKIVLPESLTTISDSAFYSCSGFTIYAPKGSYAETYALEHGYSYVATSK